MNLRTLAAALEPLWRRPRASQGPTTHDYTLKTVGHDVCWSQEDIREGGKEIDAIGWGTGIERGDFLLLRNRSTGGATRYRVQQIKYYRDPADMWSAILTFAPRAPA